MCFRLSRSFVLNAHHIRRYDNEWPGPASSVPVLCLILSPHGLPTVGKIPPGLLMSMSMTDTVCT